MSESLPHWEKELAPALRPSLRRTRRHRPSGLGTDRRKGSAATARRYRLAVGLPRLEGIRGGRSATLDRVLQHRNADTAHIPSTVRD